MPLQRIVKNGQPAYRWGQHGHCYSYTPNDVRSRELAKQKALKQGRAEHARKGGKLKQVPVSWVHLHQHTQAVLFSKRMSNAKIKQFLNHSKLKPTSIRQTKNYIRVRITEPNKLKFKYRIFQLNSNIKLVLQYFDNLR